MKQVTKKKLPALILVLCLILSNITMSFAATQTTQPEAPSLTAIEQEITATAQYLKDSAIVTELSTASNFYSASRILTLLLRSGIDCSDLVDSYLAEITTNYVSNGELTLMEPIISYGYLSIILALSDMDPANFNGINLIEKFETAITNAEQSTLNSISPYQLPHLYTVAYAYATALKDSSTCLTKIKTAILSYANENGINYWGNSADNNGLALTGLLMLSTSDIHVKTLVDHAITFSQSLLKSDGTSAGDFNWTPTPNTNSTGASLILYSTYGQYDLAAQSYVGLLTFKNAESTGSYNYTTTEPGANFGATIDALYGLISYRSLLSNQTAPFDVSDILKGTYNEVIQKINNLSSIITLNDAADLKSISTLYNSLTTAFKSKITNYTIYETAVTTYNELVSAQDIKNAVIEPTNVVIEPTNVVDNHLITNPDTDPNVTVNVNATSPATGNASSITVFFLVAMASASCIVFVSITIISNKKHKIHKN